MMLGLFGVEGGDARAAWSGCWVTVFDVVGRSLAGSWRVEGQMTTPIQAHPALARA